MSETQVQTSLTIPGVKLPTLKELNMSPEIAAKLDLLNGYLDQEPPPSFIRTKGNIADIPIDKVEFLLTKIFQQYKVEVIDYKIMFNSATVQVRLHYLNPLTGEWLYHDGLGAVGIQTDAGASASDMGAIKSDGVMKALPAAKSYAIKDAADHLGKIFGKDLNRKDTIQLTPERMSYANIFENGQQ